MVTIAVLAIILAIAVPSFTSLINSNRLSSQVNELVAGLQYARFESLRRNVRTTVCQTTNGTSCSNAANWDGWLIFTDLDKDSNPDEGELVKVGYVVSPMQLVNSDNIIGNRFDFRPDGMARSGVSLLKATLRVCIKTSQPKTNARDLEITSGSRFEVKKIDATNACSPPGNPS